MPLEPSLIQHAAQTVTLGTCLTLAAAMGLGGFLVPQVNRRLIPPVRDDALRDFLPFVSIEQIRAAPQPVGADDVDLTLDETATKTPPTLIKCRNGTYTAIIEIGGFDATFVSDDQKRLAWLTARRFLDALAKRSIHWRQHTIRRRIRLTPNFETSAPFARLVLPVYNKTFEGAFNNTRFIQLAGTDTSAAAKEKMQEDVHALMSIIKMFRPRQLSQTPSDSVSGDLTLANALGQLIAPVTQPNPGGHGDYFNAALAADNLDFLDDDKGTLVFRGQKGTLYGRFAGIAELGENTTPALMRRLTEMDCEAIITQAGTPLDSGLESVLLAQQGAMMRNTNVGGAAIEAQCLDTITMLAGNELDLTTSLHHYTPSIMALGNSAEQLNQAESLIHRIINDSLATPIRQVGTAQTSFFGQFPTYRNFPEVYRLHSQNIAHLLNFNTPSTGAQSSQWSPEPILYMKTAQRSLYRWHPHVAPRSNVAHSFHLATTGGGKTTFACVQDTALSTRPNVRTVMLDQLWGTYPYVSAMAGTYFYFKGDGKFGAVRGGINPFDCADNADNRDFLKLWLKTITGLTDNASLDEFAKIVDLAMMIPRETRSLREAAKGGAFVPTSPVGQALNKWIDPNQHGDLINGRDSIDFSKGRLFSFDMTPIFADQDLAPAFVHYLMHRLMDAMNRYKLNFNIFIDETEPAIQNAVFLDYFKKALQQMRKMGGAVSCVFQRPSALTANGVADLITSQCQTWYLYPAKAAKREKFEEAGISLSDPEWDFITQESALWENIERGVLLKRPNTDESVVLDTDLNFLGNFFRPYDSDTTNVDYVSIYREQYGDEWLTRYLNATQAELVSHFHRYGPQPE